MFARLTTMAMLEYNEILPKRVVVLEDEPYVVLTAHVFRKQQRKPVNQTKLKNLVTGKVTERAFHVSEKAEEAEIEKREVTYLYNNKGEWWFCEPKDRSKRFKLEAELLGEQGRFLKDNTLATALVFKDEIMGLELPIKVDLKVTDAPPAVKGNTAQGVTKQVTLETGATINAPIFVNEGDVIRINTETGDYVERVK
jgi:elongation factor P